GLPLQLSVAVGRSKTQAVAHSNCLSGPQARLGGVVSSTVLVCDTVMVLPLRSMAVHLHTTKIGQVPLVVLLRVTITLVPSQLSTAVTLGGTGRSLRHWKVRLVGTPTSVGGVMSCTMLVCAALTRLPQRSTAVQVQITSVGRVPLVLLVSVTVTLVPSQLSMAVT